MARLLQRRDLRLRPQRLLLAPQLHRCPALWHLLLPTRSERSATGTANLATSTVKVIKFLTDASTERVTSKFTVRMAWWRSSRTLRLTNKKMKRKSRRMTMKMGRMTNLEAENPPGGGGGPPDRGPSWGWRWSFRSPRPFWRRFI